MPIELPDLTRGAVAVTGSVATDHLMSFPGRWDQVLLPDQLERVSVSVLVDDLVVRRGGVAANIAYGLARLGRPVVLVAAVGLDFDVTGYRAWLDGWGVDTADVRVSSTAHTARFTCTTDAHQNQIASFYSGAMAEAREIALGPVAERVGGLGLVLVGPNDPAAMQRHTDEARAMGLPFAADVSQQLSSLPGEEIRSLVDGAAYLFTNGYERHLLLERTGWSPEEVLGRVGAWLTTHSERGVVLERGGEGELHVPVVAARTLADPTGVGDAFRAGFLAAGGWGLAAERCIQVGALLATLTLETVGPQEYDVDPAAFVQRLAGTYGRQAADEVAAHLPPVG